jgi:hypothetical protein
MIDVVYPFLCHKNDYFFWVKYFVLFRLYDLGTEKSFPLRSLTERKVRNSKGLADCTAHYVVYKERQAENVGSKARDEIWITQHTVCEVCNDFRKKIKYHGPSENGDQVSRLLQWELLRWQSSGLSQNVG